MRAHCVKLLHNLDVLEIVGTGGDGSNSFNISTTSSLVIASAGVPVAKHGNRAASSKSGAADVLEALGVKITVSPEKSAELLHKINICFLFAQNYHVAMKYVAPIRKELGIRTVFNILGPLSNPAGANMELMGVFLSLIHIWVMDELLGISGDVTPEKRFLYHRAHIHKEDQELFEEYAAKLAKEPTEIVYRFIHPITGEMYVRCGGKRESGSADTVRIVGTHQDISDTCLLYTSRCV